MVKFRSSNKNDMPLKNLFRYFTRFTRVLFLLVIFVFQVNGTRVRAATPGSFPITTLIDNQSGIPSNFPSQTDGSSQTVVNEEPPPEYILTIISDHGTVALNPDKATYTEGETVELTATPDAGWDFDSWSGDATGSDNPVMVTMDGNKTVTANYVLHEYVLEIAIDGSGSVAKNPDQETYHLGEMVQLTATPAEEWTFNLLDR